MTATLDLLRERYADNPEALVKVDEPDFRWSGYASLLPLLVPVESVEAHPRNPRRGNLDVIARSLDGFGQTKAIVVWAENRWIVAGNHTRRAAIERLGWTHIAAVVADMSAEDARDYLVADNRSSDLGEYDTSGLVELLEEAAEEGRLAQTGYDADSLDVLIADNDRLAQQGAEFAAGLGDTGGGETPQRPPRDPGGVHEVVLLYGDDQHAQFSTWVRAFQREIGTDSQSEAIYEAMRRAARDA